MALFTSVQSGNWTDGATWGNTSPGVEGIDWPSPNGDHFTIATGTTVTYDYTGFTRANWIIEGETLPNKDWNLNGYTGFTGGNCTVTGILNFPSADFLMLFNDAALIIDEGTVEIGNETTPYTGSRGEFQWTHSSGWGFNQINITPNTGGLFKIFGDSSFRTTRETTISYDVVSTSVTTFKIPIDVTADWEVGDIITIVNNGTNYKIPNISGHLVSESDKGYLSFITAMSWDGTDTTITVGEPYIVNNQEHDRLYAGSSVINLERNIVINFANGNSFQSFSNDETIANFAISNSVNMYGNNQAPPSNDLDEIDNGTYGGFKAREMIFRKGGAIIFQLAADIDNCSFIHMDTLSNVGYNRITNSYIVGVSESIRVQGTNPHIQEINNNKFIAGNNFISSVYLESTQTFKIESNLIGCIENLFSSTSPAQLNGKPSDSNFYFRNNTYEFIFNVFDRCYAFPLEDTSGTLEINASHLYQTNSATYFLTSSDSILDFTFKCETLSNLGTLFSNSSSIPHTNGLIPFLPVAKFKNLIGSLIDIDSLESSINFEDKDGNIVEISSDDTFSGTPSYLTTTAIIEVANTPKITGSIILSEEQGTNNILNDVNKTQFIRHLTSGESIDLKVEDRYGTSYTNFLYTDIALIVLFRGSFDSSVSFIDDNGAGVKTSFIDAKVDGQFYDLEINDNDQTVLLITDSDPEWITPPSGAFREFMIKFLGTSNTGVSNLASHSPLGKIKEVFVSEFTQITFPIYPVGWTTPLTTDDIYIEVYYTNEFDQYYGKAYEYSYNSNPIELTNDQWNNLKVTFYHEAKTKVEYVIYLNRYENDSAYIIIDPLRSVSLVESATMTIQTTTTNEVFSLPVDDSNYTPDFHVEWGDDSESRITSFDDTDIAHTYAVAGTYNITLKGNFPSFAFDGSIDAAKVQSIDFSYNSKTEVLNFEGASNLTSINNLKTMYRLIALERLFKDNTSLITIPTDSFDNAQYITNAISILQGATSFNQDLSWWDISNIEDFTNAFDNTALSIANYDATLNAWSLLNPKQNVTIGVNGLTNSLDSYVARQVLIDFDNWTFVGDTQDYTQQEAENYYSPNTRVESEINTIFDDMISESETVPDAGYSYTTDEQLYADLITLANDVNGEVV